MHHPLGVPGPCYRFGPFLADSAAGRLYHDGREVPLTPKSFKVLLVLLEMHGQLVSKEELFHQVWPDTFVEANNLARNISMVRKALHECDPDREYIVTVTGRGYRFVEAVSRSEQGHSPEEISTPDRVVGLEPAAASSPAPVLVGPPAGPIARVPDFAWRAAVILCGVVSLAAVAGLLTRSRPHAAEVQPERHLSKLTSASRFETEPSWSPDGKWIAYSSDRSGNFDIWIQPVGGGQPIQITFDAARDWQPAWSPDGRSIAFRSEREGGGLFLAPALGGAERRLTDFGYGPQWAPDASRILFTEARDVFVAGLAGDAPARVAVTERASLIGRFRVGWHPDGRNVSVYGNDRHHGWSFWTMPLGGGAPVRSQMSPKVATRLRELGVRLGGFVWAAGGDTLYFEGRSAETSNLWRVRVDPLTRTWIGGPDRLTTGSSLETSIALSPDGRRLAFGSRIERTVAWSLPFDPVSGRIIGEGEAVTPEGSDAEILDLSPDGSQLAYRVAGQNRHELWIRSLDRRADHLRMVEIGAAIIQPRWSRDGTQLAYLRRPADPQRAAAVVLLQAADNGQQRVVPASRSPEMVYDWAADGQSFLVRCRENQAFSAICRLSNSVVEGASADMHIVAADARRNLYAARHSPDGRWVSFIAATDLTRSTVFVSPAGVGPWIPMTAHEDRYFEDKPRWSPDGRTLYFLSNRNGFWNVWGRRFNPERARALGEPFQVTRFDSSLQMVRDNVADLQIGVTSRRLILPVTQMSGAVWVLDNVDR